MSASYQSVLERSPRVGTTTPTASTGTPSRSPILGPLEGIAATVSAHKGSEIYAQGEAARYCYRIVSGCVRTVKLMEDGRRHVDEFLLPGDWLGLEASDEHDFSAEAVGGVVLRRYPRRSLAAVAERDSGVARWLLDLVSQHLRNAQERILALGRKTASERIAGFLLEMLRRTTEHRSSTVLLPMGRSDIADHLGLTIETVCRCLAQFRRDGTIALSRGGVTVRDRVTLQALACATRH